MSARVLRSRRPLVAFVVLAMLVGVGVTPSAASVVPHHAVAAVPALASAKDKELVRRGDLAGAQWHVVASGKTDTIGADPEVFAWLDAAGIPFTIHVP